VYTFAVSIVSTAITDIGREERSTEAAGSGRRPEIPALTGMRGVAAYSVLIAHALIFTGRTWPPLYNLAHFAMSLFFVLSGFVIQYNYGTSFAKDKFGTATKRFLVARFARLYPLYFVGLLFSISFIPKSVFFTNPWVALADLTLTQAWFNISSTVGDVMGNSWSISTELGFYVLFIPLAATLSRVPRPLTTLVGFCTLSFVLIATLVLLYPKYEHVIAPIQLLPPPASAHPWEWLFYESPPIRALEFFAGALAAQVVITRKPPPSTQTVAPSRTALGCVAFCVVLILFEPLPSLDNVFSMLTLNFMFAPAVVTLLVIVSWYDIALTRFLSSGPLITAGDISYSVYLLQPLAFLAVINSFTGLHFFGAVAKAFCAVLITTVLSYGVYHLFEAPMRVRIRKIASPPRVTGLNSAAARAPSGE
jgi:peptidoglycan/LPS O-acetylase OafA/YrhL